METFLIKIFLIKTFLMKTFQNISWGMSSLIIVSPSTFRSIILSSPVVLSPLAMARPADDAPFY